MGLGRGSSRGAGSYVRTCHTGEDYAEIWFEILMKEDPLGYLREMANELKKVDWPMDYDLPIINGDPCALDDLKWITEGDLKVGHFEEKSGTLHMHVFPSLCQMPDGRWAPLPYLAKGPSRGYYFPF